MSSWDTMRDAISDAKRTMNQANEMAKQIAGLLRGRLRHVDPDVLKQLKRELQEFDAQQKVWKS